jgi:hypothetical protein
LRVELGDTPVEDGLGFRVIVLIRTLANERDGLAI